VKLLPLLPHPQLSRAAELLMTQDRTVQLTLALDAYDHLRQTEKKTHLRWRPALMWAGCEGALLYWWGCLAAERPAGAMQSPAYVDAWCRAYRAGAMAVGPLPWWLGDKAFHLRCQSTLIRKDPSYGGHFVHAPLDLAWWWPTGENEWQIEFE
jgi:hypothetical protein